MVTHVREYATVTDVRSTYLASTGTSNDALILDLIRSVSQEIDMTCVRSFTPHRQTRYFDFYEDIYRGSLILDRDLGEIVTLTNGDSVAVAANERVTEPRNNTPYWSIDLLLSSNKIWTYTTDPENAISLDGVWTYHTDYANAWADNSCTLAANSTSNATTITCTTGKVVAGNIIKIDNEMMYASSVATNTTDTVTVIRGVNGTTANTHTASTSITIWKCEQAVKLICVRASAALMRLRDNPLGDSVTIDGTLFQTPKDVSQFIATECKTLGLVRGVR